ncbi:hypothetical protein BOS5A_80098 [Bosea sp. EC-HK365B]|nr:hypothetical protein BOSE21B_111490 [Bosea sp. 21B]CAD5269987.1 hypothetical protein BOSE7B_20149 [Bosea sp. 7B]VVT62438.1 hypothetical protein BOS5A_80098 [Bosea sp. EC-HK365B]VXC64573.1 hypothetical protein BOSE127_30163 [Bosea sp. 127]
MGPGSALRSARDDTRMEARFVTI